MKINILHISDFHYKPEHDKDFRDSVRLMKEALINHSVDIVVFSGDLMHAIKDIDDLRNAYRVLFDPLLETFKLEKERLLVVPGNHDFQDGREMPIIASELDKIDSVSQLDKFCENARQVQFSMEKFELYNQVFSEYFGNAKELSVDGFYSYNKFTINGIIIKLVGLNSAWRCSMDSKADRGKLLFPISALKDALDDADNCDLVFCSMHHQPQDFKECVSTDMEEIIARHCHILFTGHYHRFKVEEIDDDYSGFIHCVAPATFNRYDKESQYGMCHIALDTDTHELSFVPFFKGGASFSPSRQIIKKLPLSEAKRNAVELSITLKERYNTSVRRADDLFLTGHLYDPNNRITFDSLYVEPVIRDRSWQDSLIDGKKGQRITVDSIIFGTDDIVVFGLNKCGKTSLLYRILLNTMENMKNLKTIPHYLNCRELSREKDYKIDLEQALSRDLHLNRRDTRSLFEGTKLLLLLDDFDASNERLVSQINDQVKCFPNSRVIITAEETLSGVFDENIIDNRSLIKYYFHTITTSEIHQLTLRWPGLDVKQKRVAEEKIAQIFRQMHIPFNYWTASLFLWILKKTSPENVHNNFDLVQFYINELLDQRSIVEGGQLNVQYTDFNAYLGELAAFLLTQEKYGCSREGLLEWTNSYRERVLKFTETADNTISWLLDHTVLVDYGGVISFRLKGVFEYFIAFNMSRNVEFKNKVLSDEHYYLSFGNELELLAGFSPDDEELVEEVFVRTKAIFASLMKDEYYAQVDSRLESKNIIIPGHAEAVKELTSMLRSTPTEDMVESISPVASGVPLDASRVEEKKWYESVEPTVDNLEQSLFILSRVFRNSNICNNQEKAGGILDFILLAACNLGINYTDELTRRANSEDEAKLVSTVSRLMPLVIEAFLYDALCQNNLGRVLELKLTELVRNPVGKEFMIFIVAFMLLDLNISYYSSALEVVDHNIKKGILRYCAYTKLSLIVLKNIGTDNSVYKAKQLLFKINDEIRTRTKNELERMIQQEKMDKKQQKIIGMKDYGG